MSFCKNNQAIKGRLGGLFQKCGEFFSSNWHVFVKSANSWDVFLAYFLNSMGSWPFEINNEVHQFAEFYTRFSSENSPSKVYTNLRVPIKKIEPWSIVSGAPTINKNIQFHTCAYFKISKSLRFTCSNPTVYDHSRVFGAVHFNDLQSLNYTQYFPNSPTLSPHFTLSSRLCNTANYWPGGINSYSRVY